MTNKKLKRTEFILHKDFFVKDDTKEQSANQKQKDLKKNIAPETYLDEKKKP